MSAVDTAKLLGVLGLTKTQQEYLHVAAVLQQANGYVYARDTAVRSGFRTLERLTLLRRRSSAPIYDLTQLGREIAVALGRRDNVSARTVGDGNV